MAEMTVTQAEQLIAARRAAAEEQLIEWSTVTRDRDARVLAAYQAGVIKQRICDLTGLARTTVTDILRKDIGIGSGREDGC